MPLQENILLAATMLGLGACWLGIHPRTDRIQLVKDVAALPTGIIPVSLVAIGWPAERVEARTRFRENAVHYSSGNASTGDHVPGLAIQKGLHIRHHFTHQALTGGQGAPGQMGRDQAAAGTQQWISRVRRLFVQHIQASRAQVTGSKCIQQGRFIDQSTPAGIDKDRARFHAGQRGLVYHLFRNRNERAIQADHIAAGQQFIQRHRAHPPAGSSLGGCAV